MRSFPVVYGELKRIVRRYLRGSGARVTVCTTELVHEAFLRLSHRGGVEWESRAHFFGSAARAMRQVLVGFARRQHALKRDGTPISLSRPGDPAVALSFPEVDDDVADRRRAITGVGHRHLTLDQQLHAGGGGLSGRDVPGNGGA